MLRKRSVHLILDNTGLHPNPFFFDVISMMRFAGQSSDANKVIDMIACGSIW